MRVKSTSAYDGGLDTTHRKLGLRHEPKRVANQMVSRSDLLCTLFPVNSEDLLLSLTPEAGVALGRA